MVNYLKSLIKKYDKEIKYSCEDNRLKVIECMKNNFNNYFECENEIINFQNCINNFDLKFREKYPNFNIKIINDN